MVVISFILANYTVPDYNYFHNLHIINFVTENWTDIIISARLLFDNVRITRSAALGTMLTSRSECEKIRRNH
jgi:hypothetical protein